jgi:hypothetical protein
LLADAAMAGEDRASVGCQHAYPPSILALLEVDEMAIASAG